jgi:hypothetical protein
MFISLFAPCVLVNVLLAVAWIGSSVFLLFNRRDKQAWLIWIVATALLVSLLLILATTILVAPAVEYKKP